MTQMIELVEKAGRHKWERLKIHWALALLVENWNR